MDVGVMLLILSYVLGAVTTLVVLLVWSMCVAAGDADRGLENWP